MASGYAAEIAEAQDKLNTLEVKLKEIEELKSIEPILRRDAATLTARITDLQAAAEAEKSEKAFFEGDEAEEEEAPAAPAPKPAPKKRPAAPTPAAEKDADGERKAQMRALNKKLKQIDGLKAKGEENLDEDALAKVRSEPKLRKQLAALENGEDPEAAVAEEVVDSPTKPEEEASGPKEAPEQDSDDDKAERLQLPTDPAEVEKRLRGLKKKLQQIAKLKEKGGAPDPEAAKKIDSESRLLQEVAALEEGKDEVVFAAENGDSHEEQKFECEKKLKNLKKKLEQIQKLKKDGNLDADARAKVAMESTLQKEANALQAQLGQFNKQERERVAQRLGWESEVKEIKTAEKESKKHAKAKAK